MAATVTLALAAFGGGGGGVQAHWQYAVHTVETLLMLTMEGEQLDIACELARGRPDGRESVCRHIGRPSLLLACARAR